MNGWAKHRRGETSECRRVSEKEGVSCGQTLAWFCMPLSLYSFCECVVLYLRCFSIRFCCLLAGAGVRVGVRGAVDDRESSERRVENVPRNHFIFTHSSMTSVGPNVKASGKS